MDRNFLIIGCALCFTTCGLALVAHAAEQTPTVFEDVSALKLQPVDDAVLAKQTGKGIAGDIISGVVVTLLSQWQLPNGATAVASGALAIGTNTPNQPSVQFNSSASVTGPNGSWGSGANRNASASGGQNVSVNGVSQIAQLAGNGNLGTNQALIDFDASPGSLTGGSYNNATAAAASNANGSVKASVSLAHGGIAIALQTPAGIATQTIAPASTQQAGAIAQLLQIAGNNQQVANQLQLHLQMQPMSASMLRQIGVLQALQNSVRR
ncbi:peptidase C39 [Paraburkholderia phytofirmans OLGA172]|uniref:Peptidase C39 n=1 Tax=Paraburkholderia phytofirmans OLGA172 TaxID=1417228 RepID=A0A160FM70_9BURK|nr:peptidase C39 [Paraburkholderia phytofirmans OLGA172]